MHSSLVNMFNDHTFLTPFAQQVSENPDHTAIIFGNNKLTYNQLNEKSNQVASILVSKGVKKGTLVPLFVSPSLEMIIGIIGVLKCGAAYVPIDPEYPADRISFILNETNPTIVLTNSACENSLKKSWNADLLVLDDKKSFEHADSSVIFHAPAADDLAYVIYTSGSTGKPKGVMIKHRNLISYLLNEDIRYINPDTNSSGTYLLLSYTFDGSITSLFLPLIHGKSIVIKSGTDDLFKDPAFIANAPYDFIKLTPAHLHLLIASLKDKAADSVTRRLIVGGEALHYSHVKVLVNQSSNIDIVNEYGPTETTVGCSIYTFNTSQIDEQTFAGRSIPIGKPLANLNFLLLDADKKPVKSGDPGELYVGGPQVALGYLNRPDLTSERFDTTILAENEPIYKTGDLARLLENGDFEYIGRLDDQVKIRGYRIELGEIENVLQEFSEVKENVVLAKPDKNGDKRLVAFIVTTKDFNKNNIIDYLQSRLPEFMIPRIIVEMSSFPLTTNGKIDKNLLPEVSDASSLLSNPYVSPKTDLEKSMVSVWRDLLSVERVGTTDNFFELGGNSILALKMVTILKEDGIRIPVTKLYQYPTIADLVVFLNGGAPRKAFKKKALTHSNINQDIAIIGMSGRFPGANSIEELWEAIKHGKETIHFFSDEELDYTLSDDLKNNDNYVKARGIISDADKFDEKFFGITPRMAELMDPQQRIFLEISWEALERTGYLPNKYDGTVGVYAGSANNTYLLKNVISNRDLIDKVGEFQVYTVNDKDYLSSRAAYALNLKGPAVTVQSACSTSLLAVAQATEAIRKGQCDIAIAGGVAINSPVNSGHLYEEGAMLSADGHTRSFDAKAKGTVFSDGAAVVVLKNKEQALRDGDVIFAVIKGVGVSNDGGGKGSFTAPSSEGQAASIAMAIDDSGVDPANISYIETHGTATPLGDPIEIEGLNIAFGEQEKKQYCSIGSVKSNIGHLTIAAGVTGVIKTALSLYYKQLPPSINFRSPNPEIDFENSPFLVNTELREWASDHTRFAGVSSFGVGGTNVHVILEEQAQTPVEKSIKERPLKLFCWSAKSEKSLNGYQDKLSAYLKTNIDVNISDVAFTLSTSRSDFNYRRFAVIDDSSSFVDKADVSGAFEANTEKTQELPRDTVFMFPGQGAQYVNMGKDLYEQESVFRLAMDECAAILFPTLLEDILEIIYPTETNEAATEKLKNTKYSQPALFSMGYALGKLWISWGILPTAFIGHSIGEFVAAYFSGVFSLEDGLRLIAARGELMNNLPKGSMLSARSSSENITPYLSDEIALAAVNGPGLCVLAGTTEAIEGLSVILDEHNIPNRLLATSHAFHSHMMDPVLEPFKKLFDQITLNEPIIPIVSTVTGHWLSKEEAMDASYWARHLRSTVNFSTAVQKLIDENYNVFIELGPGNVTGTLAKQHALGKSVTIVSSLEREEVEKTSYAPIFKALGTLWINGVSPDWSLFYHLEKRTRLPAVPTYAFEKNRHWLNPVGQAATQSVLLPPAPQNEIENKLNTTVPIKQMRKQVLLTKIKDLLENISGIEMQGIQPGTSFIEIGFDSLLLTQIAITLKKEFNVPLTFRQLNEQYSDLDALVDYLDQTLPPEAVKTEAPVAAQVSVQQVPTLNNFNHASPSGDSALDLINQQVQLLARQIALLQGSPVQGVPQVTEQPKASPSTLNNHQSDLQLADITPEEILEIKKPFGATAKIEKKTSSLTDRQQQFLDDLIFRYNKKTPSSKEYTQKHRAHMADPRVVSGFKPNTKELVYSLVIEKSKGCHIWDIDGNQYIDALNGFGSSMLGYQPDFIKEAMLAQIDKGYEIGPQHKLAGEVCEMIGEFTDFDRVGLCNTGSEAVLGAMRIARTVTGRSIIVAFTGSYHGIVDEVIVRGTKKLKSFPASPGIMPEAVQNMLILDYGSDEALKTIRERADEIAAVLVEPIQSRKPEYQPIEFLKEVRKITANSGTALIFDEVISGFRFHPGGAQAMFGVKADIGTYGKVIGGGLSIGAIAGTKAYMDSLDGGFWQYGDDSVPEVGVTYFAGTFVRHPLALACTKATLDYFKKAGPSLQKDLNDKTAALASRLNKICIKHEAPMFIAQFGSLWKVKYIQEYMYSELLFTLMREKGIHILDGFPCFLTTVHTDDEIEKIISVFDESLAELKAAGYVPQHLAEVVEVSKDLNTPPLPNAKLGKDRNGNPAWFISDENNPGKYLQIQL